MTYTLSGFLGQVATTLVQATADVKTSTAVVKKLTADVKIGLASRSDLLRAMVDLDTKIKIAQKLAGEGKALSGYFGEETLKRNTLLIMLGAAVLLFFLTRK